MIYVEKKVRDMNPSECLNNIEMNIKADHISIYEVSSFNLIIYSYLFFIKKDVY